MAIGLKIYSNFPTHLLNALVVGMGSETAIKCMLLLDTYTPSQDNHDFVNDVRTFEHAATGNYVTGGDVLTSTVVSVTNRVTKFDADDAEWLTSTITARYAVIYDNTEGADVDKPIIALVDFDGNKDSENGTFKIQWHVNGIFTFTVAA